MGIALTWLAVALGLALANDLELLGVEASRLGALMLLVSVPFALAVVLVQTSREVEARQLRQRRRT